MSARTKIIVLHMKEVILTTVLAIAGIAAIILLLILFLPRKSEAETSASTAKYKPGVYTSSVSLNDTSLDVQVIVDENNINSVSIVNLDESVQTMYPLVEPAMEEISKQVVGSQSIDNVTYSENNQYTSIVLLNAVKDAIEKASLDP